MPEEVGRACSHGESVPNGPPMFTGVAGQEAGIGALGLSCFAGCDGDGDTWAL
jgi:hypothetical protein